MYSGALGRVSTLAAQPAFVEGVSSDQPHTIVGIAAGLFHSIIHGSVTLSFGKSGSGRLGLGQEVSQSEEPITLPQQIQSDCFDHSTVISSSAGAVHSCFITSDGILRSTGFAGFGALGHGNDNNRTDDRHVPGIASSPGTSFAKVACGGAHTVVLTSTGSLMSCGRDDGDGRLGIGPVVPEEESGCVPTLHEVPISERIVSHDCGGFFSGCITEEGNVFTFGGNRNGELGRSETPDSPCHLPGAVEGLPSDDPPLQIALGGFHSLVLCQSGSVYSFGYGREGTLATGELRSSYRPVRVQFPDSFGARAASVAAGPKASIVVSETGAAFVCGRNFERQLGLKGKKSNQQDYVATLQQLPMPDDHLHVDSVALGAEHMLFMCSPS